MAIFQDGLVPGNMQVSLGGQIVNAGTGAGAVDFVVGVGFTAVRTAKGVYLITLSQQYQPLWACTATVQSATNSDLYLSGYQRHRRGSWPASGQQHD